MPKKKMTYNDNNLAVAYYRYSSQSQNEASIEQQREHAHLYAKAHGLQIIMEYEDKAVSGTTDNRPNYQRMLTEIIDIKPAALILWKTDRLGRNRYDLAIAKKTIRDAGCQIHYVAEAIPNDSPEATLMEGMLESMAEFYSMQLRQNIIRGMTYNAENALFNGHKILGYKKGEDKRYITDEATAPIVQKIFNDYADGKPVQKIVTELNEQGIKTSRENKYTINSLRTILNNKAYTGLYRFGDIVIPDGMPVLVSEELYERVQERFRLNRHKAKPSVDDNAPRYWLTGKLYCGECGATMHGTYGTSKSGSKYYYYDCLNHQKRKCKLKPFRKEKLEALVLEILDDFLSDSENLASLAVDIAEYYDKMYADNSYIDSLNSQLKDTEKALGNLVKAIEMGIFSETTQTRLLELETRKKALNEAIETEKVKKKIVKDDHSIKKYFEMYLNADIRDPETRDLVFEYFVDKIFVYADRIVITCTYGDKVNELDFNEVGEATESVRNERVLLHHYLYSGMA